MMEEQSPAGEKYTVLVIDMFHYDSDEDFCVGYFPGLEAAREYARRRTRGTVEENRAASAVAGARPALLLFQLR